MKKPYIKVTGYTPHVLNFDEGFLALLKSHIAMGKNAFDQIIYDIERISAEEFQKQKESSLFMKPRGIYRKSKIVSSSQVAEEIISLEPTEERLRKSEGVILEILIHYDMSPSEAGIILDDA